jgi:hypothetical protein
LREDPLKGLPEELRLPWRMFRERLRKGLLVASCKGLREALREGLREARRKGLQEARRKGLRGITSVDPAGPPPESSNFSVGEINYNDF